MQWRPAKVVLAPEVARGVCCGVVFVCGVADSGVFGCDEEAGAWVAYISYYTFEFVRGLSFEAVEEQSCCSEDSIFVAESEEWRSAGSRSMCPDSKYTAQAKVC